MSDPYLDGIMQKVMATGQEVVVEDVKAAIPAPASALVEKAIRVGCTAADIHLTCSYPDCKCKQMPKAIAAAISIVVEECAKVAETAWTEFAGTPETAVLNCHHDIAAAIRRLDGREG